MIQMSLKWGVIMSQEISEIGKILEKHHYSMTSVLVETAQTFKLRSIVRNAGFEKQQGYSVVEIMTLMLVLPFLLVNSVHNLFVSDFKRITEMKKDTILSFAPPKHQESSPFSADKKRRKPAWILGFWYN